MTFRLVVAGLTAITLVYVLIKRLARPSLTKIRGPKSSSFLLGHMLDLLRLPAGQIDFAWQERYGDVIRFKGLLGEDRLLVADPKALQRIFNTVPYRYPREYSVLMITRMFNGQGILSMEGEAHKRHRRILVPGFGGSELKIFHDVFRGCAESLSVKWLESIGNSPHQKAVLDISDWLSRATLDAIGQAAFNIQFDAIKDYSHPLARAYHNMVHGVFGRLSGQQAFAIAATKYVPVSVLKWLADRGSNPRLELMRTARNVTEGIAKELVREKAEMLSAGESGRDILTLLVKANIDAEAKNKLTEMELYGQMQTILIAGHETTTTVLSWTLLELARNPTMQSRLRAEIRQMETVIRARGDTRFTVADLESDTMPYLTAVTKEGLRYHPPAPRVNRIADCDDILPLSRPVTTESGKVVSEIVVPKGTEIVASIAAYNRNRDLWGEDAHQFNPDRWINGITNEKKSVLVGLYANLMTFATGARGCLGWRFAVIEIQTFLVEIISRFELTMAEESYRVCRGPTPLMTPMLDGQLELGAELPLAVSVAAREN